jgi:hypothetical protein
VVQLLRFNATLPIMTMLCFFIQAHRSFKFNMAETMRISYPPVRFSEQKMVVPSRRVQLKPFQGQRRKYAGTVRLPQLVMEKSKIANAGIGLFLAERVRAGQVLTLYRRNSISEVRGKVLKMKVSSLYPFT